jgi:PII interaction protein X
MANEIYLNHPTFGLLFSVCAVLENRELYTTLYAQRLFFLVTTGSQGLEFEPVSRSEARLVVENRLRNLRRNGQNQEYNQLQEIHRRTFQ